LSIKEEFEVYSVPFRQVKPWLLKKHYAQRIPPVQYAFGLYKENELVGVCTFGNCVSYREHNAWEPYDLYELNRLVTEDNLPKNALSYFVSRCIKLMPSPCVLVSFADPNKNHHGYIYQATNWIYVGQMEPGGKSGEWIINNKVIHNRSIVAEKMKEICGDSYDPEKTLKENFRQAGGIIETPEGKYKYYYFVGNKREKKKMKDMLRYEELPYPKGENENYDTGDKLYKQQRLF